MRVTHLHQAGPGGRCEKDESLSPGRSNRLIYPLPIENGTIHESDLRQIKTADGDFGLMSYDPAFLNMAACQSSITFATVTLLCRTTRAGWPDLFSQLCNPLLHA